MDPLLMLPIIIALIIALFCFLTTYELQKEQERFEDLASRLESLSEASRARLRRLRRLSRFNLYANIQGLREFDREIRFVERNNGIYASYRLRRLTVSTGHILDNMEGRITEIERALAASR